jgi:hypothetical protein
LSAVYGDQTVCAMRMALSCTRGLHARDATSNPAGVAGCTHVVPTLGCQALLQNGLPPECSLAPGARPNGQVCASDAQCQSTRCARNPAEACGACAALGSLGDACNGDSDCPRGSICGAGRCQEPARAGEPCDATRPCAVPLACSGGQCVDASGAGEACQAGADRCSRDLGLSCGQSGVCAPWPKALPGQSCGVTETGWVACSAGSTCSSETSAGTCQGPLPDGSPCNPLAAPYCLSPARCINGVCSLDALEACP